jgi:hypothetical protein
VIAPVEVVVDAPALPAVRRAPPVDGRSRRSTVPPAGPTGHERGEGHRREAQEPEDDATRVEAGFRQPVGWGGRELVET